MLPGDLQAQPRQLRHKGGHGCGGEGEGRFCLREQFNEGDITISQTQKSFFRPGAVGMEGRCAAGLHRAPQAQQLEAHIRGAPCAGGGGKGEIPLLGAGAHILPVIEEALQATADMVVP